MAKLSMHRSKITLFYAMLLRATRCAHRLLTARCKGHSEGRLLRRGITWLRWAQRIIFHLSIDYCGRAGDTIRPCLG